ncbi:hypothetical protein ACS0TY_016386 [Phlomoides rotata]
MCLIIMQKKILCIAKVGDITPPDGITKVEKSRREREALQKMCELLGGGEQGTLELGTRLLSV